MSNPFSKKHRLIGAIKRLGRKPDTQQEQHQKEIDELNEWLEDQILNDARKSVVNLSQRIEALLEQHVDSSEHLFQLTETLRPVIAKRLQQIRSEFVMLAAADLLHFDSTLRQTDRLLSLMAQAYKQVRDKMVATSDKDPEPGIPQTALIASYRATIYQAARMLQAYLSYRQPPEGLWRELHQCFQIAEQQGCADTEIPIEAQERQGLARPSVRNAYKRLLVVAASNPYRMMRNEADMLFSFMTGCAYLCRTETPSKENTHLGSILVDLESDEGPFYLEQGLSGSAENFRVLLPGNILENLRTEAATATRNLSAINQPTNEDRLRRDMILRVMRLWEEPTQRKQKRISVDGTAEVTAAVPAVCERLFGPNALKPKKLDHRLRTHCDHALDADTVPLYEDWELLEDVEEETEDILVPPTWGTEEASDDGITRHQIVDVSEGGLMIHWASTQPCTAQIGDVAAWRTRPDAAWSIGTVRWMYAKPDGYNIGFMDYSKPTHPCWIKTRKNNRTQYFRGLILGSENPSSPNNQLIVPLGMLAVGDSVWLVQQRSLAEVTLISQRGASPTISQFNFTVQTLCLDPELKNEIKAAATSTNAEQTDPQ